MTDIIVRKPNKHLAKNDPFAGLSNISESGIVVEGPKKTAMDAIYQQMQPRNLDGIRPATANAMTYEEKMNLPKTPESLKFMTVGDILRECVEANFESISHTGDKEHTLKKEWVGADGQVHREYTNEGYRCSVATLAEWLHKGYKCPDPVGHHDKSYLVAKKYKLRFADYLVRCPVCGGKELQEVELCFHLSADHDMRVPKVASVIGKFELSEGIY